jgi:hypothetical protein
METEPMMPIRTVCLVPLSMLLGCSFTQDLGGPNDTTSKPQGEAVGRQSALPLSDLQYPTGLWVRDGKVYFLEAAEWDTKWRGASRLSVYDLATQTRTMLVDKVVNNESVVVASDGKIYLGGWSHLFPGNHGQIAVVDAATGVETPILDLDASVADMFIDDEDDIYVLTWAYDDTRTIFRLPAGDYAHPLPVLDTAARMMTFNAGSFFFTDFEARHGFTEHGITRVLPGALPEEQFVPTDASQFAIGGLTTYGGGRFYGSADCSPGGRPR